VNTPNTSTINATAARRLLGNIERDLRDQLRKTKDSDPLEALLTRSRHVLNVALIPSRSDGWPSSTSMSGNSGGGSGMAIIVPDENGQPDRVPVTSTEQAALFAGRDADQVTPIAREVLSELATIQASLVSLKNALDRFDNIRDTSKIADGPQCYVASVMYRLPWDPTWKPNEHITTLAGLLPGEQRVCQFVYGFHQRQRRLPTKDEMLTHLRRGTVRLYAS
jgi:hypothetical protein